MGCLTFSIWGADVIDYRFIIILMLLGWWILCFCYYSKTFGWLSHIWYCRRLQLISPGTHAFKVPYNEKTCLLFIILGMHLFPLHFFFSGVACVQMSIPLVRTISFCFRMISAKIFFGFITKVIEIMCKPAWSIWFWPSPFALYVNRLLNQGLMKQLPKSTMLHGWKL